MLNEKVTKLTWNIYFSPQRRTFLFAVPSVSFYVIIWNYTNDYELRNIETLQILANLLIYIYSVDYTNL